LWTEKGGKRSNTIASLLRFCLFFLSRVRVIVGVRVRVRVRVVRVIVKRNCRKNKYHVDSTKWPQNSLVAPKCSHGFRPPNKNVTGFRYNAVGVVIGRGKVV
jgi:hypothetical protein